MNRLLSHLPQYEKGSSIFQEIMKVEEIEFNRLDAGIRDLEQQFIVDTATWALTVYEKELGLPIEPNASIEIRRSIIKSKMLMQPPSSKVKLVEILKSFIETAEIEEHFSEYRFDVILKTLDTVGDKLQYIKDIVDEFKPAHLGYIFIICYLYYPKLYTQFKKYYSDKFKICGTIDVSGNKYYSTEGRSYKELFKYIYGRWLSSKIPVISKDRKINNVGVTYKSGFMYNYNTWLSSIIPVMLEGRIVEGPGLYYKDSFQYDEKSYFSEPLQACSEVLYVKEVTT